MGLHWSKEFFGLTEINFLQKGFIKENREAGTGRRLFTNIF